MQNTQNDLLRSFVTRQELLNFLSQLDELQQYLYNLNIDLGEKLSELIPMHKKELLMAHFAKNNISPQNKAQLMDFITSFKEQARSLPVVTLSVAFDPAEEVVKHLAAWLEANLPHKVLLDFTIRQTVMGGAIVTYNGFYKDYSLKKIFAEKFLQRNLLGEMLPNN